MKHPVSKAYQRFLESMQMDFAKWHDGIGYDLQTLRDLAPDEQEQVAQLLIARGIGDWRDVDALAVIASESALAALKAAVQSDRYEVRIRAVECLLEKHAIGGQEIETVLVETLPRVSLFNGQTFTLRLAEQYPTSAVKRVLLWCALHGKDDIRVHAAALVYYLYGVAKSAFDWQYRDIFLRFREQDYSKRLAAYTELCRDIQVDPGWADQPGA